MRFSLWLVVSPFLVACGPRVLTVPGPLGPVAKAPPPALHIRDLPRTEDAVAAPADPVAPPPPAEPEPTPAPPRKARRGNDSVARAARHYLENTPPSRFRNDCSGYVMAVYDRAGLPLSGNSASLWKDLRARGSTHTRKRPRVGDLAFFDNTYDKNRNGKRDDPLTHIAVVIEVRDDGTILLGHGGTSKGRTELRMNLSEPDVRTGPDGSVLNDYLRARRKGESKDGRYLAGQLWRGFATVEEPGS